MMCRSSAQGGRRCSGGRNGQSATETGSEPTEVVNVASSGYTPIQVGSYHPAERTTYRPVHVGDDFEIRYQRAGGGPDGTPVHDAYVPVRAPEDVQLWDDASAAVTNIRSGNARVGFQSDGVIRL